MQMSGGMPVARLPAAVLGGWGHLLLMIQVCRTSSTLLYEHTQLFCTAVLDQCMSTSRLCSWAHVGQRVGALSDRPRALFMRRAQYWQH